jgi:aspartyl-tRNA(Asn)/glutamyl-tRNA(Gln) amidotransferase subunit A
LDAVELADQHARGARSVVATIDDCLRRIEVANGRLNAFLALDAEGARQRAARLEAATRAGARPGRLHGVPIAIKANQARRGLETNCASRMLAGWRAPYTATAVERLEAEGAIVVGATNMDEYAMGSTGEHSAFGATRNPWSLAHAPGGSSSGSAAAVAARLVPLALGSDTGGSVRQPAAWCGVAGLKPTWGRISRHGLVAFASSLDCIAPLARCVDDLELALGIMAGADPRDASCLPEPAPARVALEGLAGLRLGVVAEWSAALEPGPARELHESNLRALRATGAELVDVSLATTRHAIACYYIVAAVEAASNLSRYDGSRYGLRADEGARTLAASMSKTRRAGFGPEVQRRIVLGTWAHSAGWSARWHQQAARVRTKVAREFADAFEQCDLLVGPTAPTPALRLGAHASDPSAMYACDALTTPVSLAGLPAANIPAGLVEVDGIRLPFGLQFVGPLEADMLVLAASRVAERVACPERLVAPDTEGLA